MTPDVEQRLPQARPITRPSTTRHAIASATPAGPSVVTAPPTSVTPATRAHSRARIRWTGIAFALGASIALGLGLTAFLPRGYQSTAEFTLNRDSVDMAEARAALMDCMWSGGAGRPSEWTIKVESPDRIQLTQLSHGAPRDADARAKELIRSVDEALRAQHAPNEGERLLGEWMSDSQERLRESSSLAAEAVPDPRAERDAAVATRTDLHTQYQDASALLSQASGRLAALRTAGPPETGVIAPDRRREAQQADLVLEQDLRELTVRLAELRAELVAAATQAEERLGQVAEPASALLQALRDSDQVPSGIQGSPAITSLASEVDSYLQGSRAFSAAFSRELQVVLSLDADPYHDDLLEAYSRLRKAASDYLFQASKLLTTMRQQVYTINEGDAAAPQNYKFSSELTRLFGQAQTTHHRFEFVAAKIDAANNFKLDSALRASRGLRSRSRERLEAIEKSLQADALRTARDEYGHNLAGAENAQRAARERVDEIVGALLQTDSSVLASIAPGDQFLEAAIRRDIAARLAADQRGQVEQLQALLDRLSAKRRAIAEGPVLKLVRTETTLAPRDLERRLGIGGAAAAISLLSILLGQWWLARRT